MKNVFAQIKGLFAKKVAEVPSPIADIADMTTQEKIDANQQMSKIMFFIIAAVVFLFPLFFVPVLSNWYDLTKSTLLVMGMLVAVTVWLLQGGLNKKLNLTRTIFDLSALVFVVVAVISAALTINKVMSLSSETLVYVGGFLLFFLISQTVNKENKLLSLVNVVLASSSVLAVWSLAQLIGSYTKVNFPLFSFAFNPTGAYLAQIMLLVATLPLAIGAYLKTKKGLNGVFLALIIVGLVVSAYVLYKNPPVLLDIETGWKISTGTMGRSLTSAIFGMGPGNYIDAFTLYKPVDFNLSKFWNMRFTGGANFYFYVLSTIGIAGLAALIFLISKLVMISQKHLEMPTTDSLEKGLIGSLGIILVTFFFLPGPAILIVAFFTLLGLLVAHFSVNNTLNVLKIQEVKLSANVWLAFVPALLAAGLTIAGAFFLGKMVLADYYFGQAMQAAAKNQGTQTYNLQIKAISLNPDNDVYHTSYSQTNLALADSLASQPNLTDQQKSAVVQLVQQAIREGRMAAALNPNRVSNWENLSLIYRSLINFAQGADQWTVASMNQAIALDPGNPRLRLDLGGLYFAAKDYTTAGQIFAQAASLKQDYANAHYNLAQAYKSLGVKDQAIKELQTAGGLVCGAGQSADCDQVNNEIAALGSTAAATPAAATPVVDQTAQLATAAAQEKSLPKVKAVPPVKISSPSGQIQP